MKKILLITLLIFFLAIPVKADVITPPVMYLTFLPLVHGGNIGLARYVSAGFPFYPEERELWCNNGFSCTAVETLDSFVYTAPPGESIYVMRLFAAYWFPPNGAHIIFPFEGCARKICIRALEGSMTDGTMTKVEIYIDETQWGWGGPVHLADFHFRPVNLYSNYTEITVLYEE